MSYVKIQRSIFQPIEDMIKIGLYKNEQEAIAALVHDQAKNKSEQYSKKIKKFEKKYKMDFSDFEAKINSASEEIFEEWDDYILWESYVKAYSIGVNLHDCITYYDQMLQISESNGEDFRRYSYHLQDGDRIIKRWDNAPHWNKVKTHPFHAHVGDQKEPVESKEMYISDVIEEIRSIFGIKNRFKSSAHMHRPASKSHIFND